MNNVMFAGETNTTWENLWIATPPHSASNSFLKRTIKQITCVFDFQYKKVHTAPQISNDSKMKKNLCLVSLRPTSLLFIGHLLCSDR